MAWVLTACASTASEELPVTDSQLREYLEVIEMVVQDAGPEAIVRRSVQREEAIADCMAQLGFDYVPVPTTAESQGMVDADFYLGMGTLEWVQQNGYGISTNPVYTDLVTDTGEESGSPDTDADNDSGADLGSLAEQDPNAEIFEAIAAMTEQVEEDPDVQAVVREWSACMSEQGHTGFRRPSEVVAYIEERLDALMGAEVDAEGEPGLPGDETEAGEAGEAGTQTGPTDAAALQELNREEAVLATADVECSASTGLDDARGAVQARLENQYVQQHRDSLERVRLMIAEYSG